MEYLTDDIIIDIFKDKRGKINSFKTRKTWIENHIKIKEYLENRYPDDDFISYTFILQRIFNHIDDLPRCQNCGKKLYSIGAKWCNQQCQFTDPNFIKYREQNRDFETQIKKWKENYYNKSEEERKNIKNKMIETKKEIYGNDFGKEIYKKIVKSNLEKYGVENTFQYEKFKEKIKQTCLKKYGDENYRNPEKTKKTIKEKYGIDNWMSSNEFKSQSKKTKLEKYGDENYTNKEKAKETCIKHFGVDNWGKTKESIEITHTKIVNQKRVETKRKNHTFNTSKPEKESYKLLKEKYPDVKYQYKSKEYPFACDFYIPSLNLYIECNYHWTHGGKPYEDTIEDNLIVEKWKGKNTKYFNNAIKCWTIRDPKKRQMAKDNNLNYIEFWNIDELKDWLNSN